MAEEVWQADAWEDTGIRFERGLYHRVRRTIKPDHAGPRSGGVPALGGAGEAQQVGIRGVVLGNGQAREGEHKAGRLVAARRVEAHVAALQMSQAPGDRQSESAASARRPAGKERVEQVRPLVCFRAGSAVLDGDL